MLELYNFRKIHDFLFMCFDLEDLKKLCLTTPEFKIFYYDLESYRKLSEAVTDLISFADRRGLINILLEEAEKLNPIKYQDFKPFINMEKAGEFIKDDSRKLNMLMRFFNLEAEDPNITIYLSRHSTTVKLPKIKNTIFDGTERDLVRDTIDNYQNFEQKQNKQDSFAEQNDTPDKFAVVSAVEMLEAIYFKEEIENLRLRDLYPKDSLEELLDSKMIKVNLEVCPEPTDYQELLDRDGTEIFIGGPRANLGTYYYLYGFGSKAGAKRPGRLSKNVIEDFNNQGMNHKCDENHNLAIIQKHRIISLDKTIFYLSGTGANGTAAAVAYLRDNWPDLLKHCEENFSVVIKVDGGKVRQENFTIYNSNYWNNKKWEVIEYPCKLND